MAKSVCLGWQVVEIKCFEVSRFLVLLKSCGAGNFGLCRANDTSKKALLTLMEIWESRQVQCFLQYF
ncbi:hypothetical protein LH29_05660 [Draconibacterium sediminis]|uniref:Uncharacterized protein n=1 Tax=Draconibacterium sediminis TaxID=1544798 RepID=A0A0D8JDC5_9BACT|nr:hypothetical protein LH29_05660 [Draconibacterium sediminis]